MKICMICPELGNSAGNAFIGGHANTVVQLTQGLFERGHEITIITTPHRYPGDMPNKDILREWADVHVLQITGSYSSIRYGFEFSMKAIKKIRDLNYKKKFDVIHGHSGYTMPSIITGLSSKFTKVPSVQTIYCPIKPLTDSYNFCRIFSNNTFSTLYLRNIAKIIAVTTNINKSLLISGIPKERTMIIPPGINNKIYNPNISGEDVRKYYNIDANQQILAYVGNLSEIKGLHILIDSMNLVIKKRPDIKLFMILNMPLESYEHPTNRDIDMGLIYKIKDKIADYRLENNIIPFGLLDNMAEVLASSDVFITPFLNTVGVVDYPISMIEAMALGKPIIATRVGGIPEIITHGKNGILVDPNDEYELSDAIIYMLDNTKKREIMSIEGIKVSEQFYNNSVIDKLESVYTEAKRTGGSN